MQEFLLTIAVIFILFRLFRGSFFIYRFNGNNQKPFNQYHDKKKQEGEITIENTNDKNLNKSNDDGEYVDYEEVK